MLAMSPAAITKAESGLGFASTGTGGGGAWDLVTMGVSRTFDILERKLTPPTYESSGPGGTTIIRSGVPTQRTGVDVDLSKGKASLALDTGTILLAMAGVAVLLIAMRR